MDFDFTDDPAIAARRRVALGRTGLRRRAASARHRARRRLLARKAWGEIAELGLPGLALPESQGGMGFGAVGRWS